MKLNDTIHNTLDIHINDNAIVLILKLVFLFERICINTLSIVCCISSTSSSPDLGLFSGGIKIQFFSVILLHLNAC